MKRLGLALGWCAYGLTAQAATQPAAPVPKPAAKSALATTDHQDTIDRLGHELDKIDHALVDTKQMIRTSLDAPYLPDLYFHLAELYVDRSRFEHQKGLEQQGDNKRILSEDRSLIVQVSKKLAIETYEKIANDFPDYPRKDQIYFFEGHEYRELGQWEQMTKVYTSLIEKLPKSPWAIEARLVLANFHFDKTDYDDAEKYYKDILALPESRVHSTARYRLGWIHMYREDLSGALELFREAMSTAEVDEKIRPAGAASAGGANAKHVSIKREALMAMAWPFSEVKRPYQAPEYFRRLADNKQLYLEALRKLATRYQVKNRLQASAFLFREIVRLSTDGELNLEYVEHIFDTVTDMPVEKETRHLTVDQDVGGLSRTAMELRNRPEPVKHRPDAPNLDEPKVLNGLEQQSRDLATKAQTYAQNNNDKRIERLAADAYSSYLYAFDGSREQPAMELNRAGALFEGAEYLPAGQQYEAVADVGEKSKTQQTDVYNAIVAYYKAIQEDQEHRNTDPDHLGTMNKLELLRAREGLKHLGAFYIKKWPTNYHAPEVRFNIARMYYQTGDFAKAAELFTNYVKAYPTRKDVSVAGQLAMDALYKLEMLDQLASTADEFAHDNRITDQNFKAEAAKLADAARKRKVEFTIIGTSDADFGKKMVSEWEKHRGSKEGEDFLYAGFSKFKSDGDWAQAMNFGEKLMGAYPDSKFAPEVIGTMGGVAATSTDFERAAWMYEEYQKRFPKDKNANEYLSNAAQMRMLLGQNEQAAQDFSLLHQVGSAEQRILSSQKLLIIDEASGATGSMGTAAAQLLSDRESVTGHFYAGLAADRDGDMREAKQHYLAAAHVQAANDGEEQLQARALYELAHAVHKSFDNLQFASAQDEERVLKAKLKLLNDTEQAYLVAIKSGDSRWALAATYETARLYHDFATFISKAPTPAGVPEDQYRAALEEQAQPYGEKGKATLDACAQKAEQLKVLSVFGTACIKKQTAEVDEGTQGGGFHTHDGRPPGYQQEMDKLRLGIVKNPKNGDALRYIAKRAMAVGDWNYARMVLSTLQENGGGKGVDGLMGRVLWELNEPQAAALALEKGRRMGDPVAALNLAGLYYAYGYRRGALMVMPDKGKLKEIDLQSAEVHPMARKVVSMGAAPEEAP